MLRKRFHGTLTTKSQRRARLHKRGSSMGHQPVGNGKIGSRTVVITGGNTGLGFGCANTILKSPNGAPWHVVLACRDASRAQAAVDQLTSGVGVVRQVEAMSLDL